ncbi:MAG: Mur ligase [Gammaproteobacteria bacterium]|nr:Mur ligase [Gammaproteobacteria bacterium]
MEIPFPDSRHLILDGCRRLTGASLVWDKTGAVLDVLVEDMDPQAVLDCWYSQVNAVLAEVEWQQPDLTHRRFENGFNLLLAAPVDQLYSAVLVLETSWYFCSCELLGLGVEAKQILLDDIREQIQLEKNDALIELQAAAADHGVDCLIDDEVVSLGHGIGVVSYPVDQIPSPTQVNWGSIHDVPVALITGTNGKSTSVRLLDGIARAAGQQSGVTSTDFVRVGDEVLDQGDYSGPGGARLLLRDPRLEVAFLEVARGGILRRGLPLCHAQAALVTNVASDHLGQYGVNTLAALTEAKFVVSKPLREDGVLVVNADDVGIVGYLADRPRQNLCWFSLEKANPKIQQQLDNRGLCCFSEDGNIVFFDGAELQQICKIRDIPMTLDGVALHNVRNALGAVGVASAMNYSAAQIAAGLCHFNSDELDNPGRLNIFQLANSARVIVDFAHNAHSVEAVTNTVGAMQAGQKWALFGSAGDRSDDEIAEIAHGVCATRPDHVVIVEVESYLRGRAPGEVSEIIKQACLQSGMTAERIHFAPSPLAGVKLVIERLQADDLGMFLVLSERDQVIEYIKSK